MKDLFEDLSVRAAFSPRPGRAETSGRGQVLSSLPTRSVLGGSKRFRSCRRSWRDICMNHTNLSLRSQRVVLGTLLHAIRVNPEGPAHREREAKDSSAPTSSGQAGGPPRHLQAATTTKKHERKRRCSVLSRLTHRLFLPSPRILDLDLLRDAEAPNPAVHPASLDASRSRAFLLDHAEFRETLGAQARGGLRDVLLRSHDRVAVSL